jgi:hypothetical protein
MSPANALGSATLARLLEFAIPSAKVLAGKGIEPPRADA